MGRRTTDRSFDQRVEEVTRRRLAALTAELAAARGESVDDDAAAPVSSAVAEEPDPDAAPDLVGRHAARPLPLTDRVTGWLGDHAPPALQGRANLGSAQVGVVVVVLLLGLGAGLWFLVGAGSGRGTPAPVVAAPTLSGSSSSALEESPTSSAPVVGETPTAETPTTEAGGQIVVDVVGKVRKPGIAVLPAGSRVVDAVKAAGGIRPGVHRKSVNLARPLTDGEQVVIGGPAPSGPVGQLLSSPGATSSDGNLVNLNTADQTALETLPGVGPVTAAAIIQWRTEHGGFTAVDELLEVSGIGDATLAEIAPHVTL